MDDLIKELINGFNEDDPNFFIGEPDTGYIDGMAYCLAHIYKVAADLVDHPLEVSNFIEHILHMHRLRADPYYQSE